MKIPNVIALEAKERIAEGRKSILNLNSRLEKIHKEAVGIGSEISNEEYRVSVAEKAMLKFPN